MRNLSWWLPLEGNWKNWEQDWKTGETFPLQLWGTFWFSIPWAHIEVAVVEVNIYFCFIERLYAKAFDCVDHNKLWKILKEIRIPDHLTCLLRNLCAGQEATVGTGHGTTDWFQIMKGVCQGCILSPCLFNLYAEYIMRNAGLEEAQAGIKIAGRNINNLRYADDTTLMAKSKEELKSLLLKVKEESKKVGLKLNFQKAKIMASCPITSWQIHGETMETVTDFIFLGFKITADGDCSHEMKTVAPWKKSYDQPRQHIKNQRHYFAKKGPSSQSYDFSSHHVCMWELGYKDSRAPKNEHFWTVVLEKTLESPLDCKEIQPVHLKGISHEYSLEGLMLKLKLQYFGHLMWRADSFEKSWERLKSGGEGDDRGWDGWVAWPTQWTWVWVDSRSWWWTGKPGVLQSMGSKRVRDDWAAELNWAHIDLSKMI